MSKGFHESKGADMPRVGILHTTQSGDDNELIYNQKVLEVFGLKDTDSRFNCGARIIDFNQETVDFTQQHTHVNFFSYIEERVKDLDAIVLPGNFYNQVEPNICHSPVRTNFERELFHVARSRGIPILAICGGAQLIAHDVGAQIVAGVGVEHAPARVDESAHPILIKYGTRLHGLAGQNVVGVNSKHSQAVFPSQKSIEALADNNLQISALATSSTYGVVVEGYEERFGAPVMAVQFHPEYLCDKVSCNIMTEHIEAAKVYSARKKVMAEIRGLPKQDESGYTRECIGTKQPISRL